MRSCRITPIPVRRRLAGKRRCSRASLRARRTGARDGVGFDVGGRVLGLALRTHAPIEIITRPEGAAAIELGVGGMGRERLPTMNDAAQWPTLRLQGQDMNVGVHHAPGVQMIAAPVEVAQRVANEGGDSWISQAAASDPGVQLRLRRAEPILGRCVLKLGHEFGGKRVGEAEDDVLQLPGRVEMRNVAARPPTEVRVHGKNIAGTKMQEWSRRDAGGPRRGIGAPASRRLFFFDLRTGAGA